MRAALEFYADEKNWEHNTPPFDWCEATIENGARAREALEATGAPFLRPCPFCGGKPILYSSVEVERHHVFCTVCRVETIEWMTKNLAVEAWNKRHGEEGK